MLTLCGIILAHLAVGTGLSALRHALEELSPGGIRQLLPERPALAEQARHWLARRGRQRLGLHLWLTLNVVGFAVVLVAAARRLAARDLEPGVTLGVVLVGAAGFVLVTETASPWLATYRWTVLRVGLPLLAALQLLAFPVLGPALLLRRRRLNPRDPETDPEPPSAHDELHALLEHAAARDRAAGAPGLEAGTGRMLRGVLDLDHTPVKEIMTPRVDIQAAPLGGTVAALRQRVVETGHSRLPIYREDIDDIVGIVYAKDLLDDERIRVTGGAIQQLMHRPIYLPETKNVNDLLEEFRQSKVHLAVVIDEYGGTAGLVTLEDILEEIVGDIADEFEADTPAPAPLALRADGTVELEARTPIAEVCDALHLPLPATTDQVTIGGYVTSLLGRIPRPTERFTCGRLDVTVTAADERKVERLRLRPLPPADDED